MRPSGGRFATINPANGETLAEMSAGTAEDIDRAVAAAKRALQERRVVAHGAASAHGGAVPLRGADRPARANRWRCSKRWTWASRSRTSSSVDLPSRHRHDPLHVRVHRQDRRLGHEHRSRRHAHGVARAARRGRRDLAVELPAADGGVEDRARAGRRQQRGAEARRAGADELPAARGAVRRSRRAAGRVQRGERTWARSPARRSRCIRTSPRSRSPAPPRSAS